MKVIAHVQELIPHFKKQTWMLFFFLLRGLNISVSPNILHHLSRSIGVGLLLLDSGSLASPITPYNRFIFGLQTLLLPPNSDLKILLVHSQHMSHTAEPLQFKVTVVTYSPLLIVLIRAVYYSHCSPLKEEKLSLHRFVYSPCFWPIGFKLDKQLFQSLGCITFFGKVKLY